MRVRVGVDIGGTKTQAVAVRADGTTADASTVVGVHVEATRPGPVGVAEGLRTAYLGLVGSLDPATRVVSVGIGVPGVVRDGTVAHAVNLGVDEPVDLAGAARELLGDRPAPVTVENDVTAAVRGASGWLRESRGTGEDLALLNVGTGLAAGLVLDGVLRRGSRGMAGEIGHLVRDPAGPPCPCGKRGCLELYASGGGIARHWSGSARELFAAAARGHVLAGRVRDDLVDGLAQAVRILVQTTDVAEVVLTGGVVSSTPALQTALVDELTTRYADSPFDRALAVHERLRWLPRDYPAGAVGAATAVPLATESALPGV